MMCKWNKKRSCKMNMNMMALWKILLGRK